MKNLLFPLLALLLLSACTKVIDIDLNSSSPQIAIEAQLLEGIHDFTVRITQTGNYFSTDAPLTVADATVSLQRGAESPIELNNVGNGNYEIPNYVATANTPYVLTVNAGGSVYQASSFLPKPVALDTLVVEVADQPPFGAADADSFQIVCHFQDPAAETNFYRIKTVVNGIPHSKGEYLLVIDDRLINGNYIQIPIFTDAFELNDQVEVELVSMDAQMYDYFNTLSLLVGNGNSSAAPANPKTNWSGGALGYFGAFSISRKTVVVR